MLNSHGEKMGGSITARKNWRQPEVTKLVGAIQQSIFDKVENGLDLLTEEIRFYERALCRIIHEQPDSAGAKIAKAALRHVGERVADSRGVVTGAE
jgi:rubrerythrin